MEVTAGIDLGESCCVAAVFDTLTDNIHVLKNDQGERSTPCAILMENGLVTIGKDAAEAHAAGNPNAAMIYPSMIGDSNYTVTLDGKQHTAKDLLCAYLHAFKKNVEAANRVTITAAAITVPPYFAAFQNAEVKYAAEQAGFQNCSILTTCAAAATAASLSDSEAKTVMVYDLGGSSFTATVLKIHGDQVDILATSTNHQLGGKNWTFALASHIGHSFFQEYGINIEDHSEDYQLLRECCENAKIQLSDQPYATVEVQCANQCDSYDVTRQAFEQRTAALLNETLLSVGKCFEQLGKDWNSIDEIVTAGGASQMPQVHQMLQKHHGKPPLTGKTDAFATVAAGAAKQAASLQSQWNDNEKSAVILPRSKRAAENKKKTVVYHTVKYKVSPTSPFRITVNFACDSEIVLPPMRLTGGTPPPLTKDAGTIIHRIDGLALKKAPFSRKYTGKVTVTADPSPLTTKFVLFLEDDLHSSLQLKVVSTL